jgi:hypothetical protein
VSEISAYLQSLREALAGSDPALIQDALAETEARFRRERERLAWAEPLLSPPDAAARILDALGDPRERAASYLQRERVVAEALGAVPAAPSEDLPPERPWPGFFGVLADPRAYTSLVYLLVSFMTGLLYFIWTMVGLSLSLGLLVLIIGLPMLVLFLGSVRALGLGEGRLDVRMPRRPPLLPEGRRWSDRLKALFVDPYTWKCLVYTFIHWPLSLITFLLTFLGLAFSLALVAAPFAHWCWQLPVVVTLDQEFLLPTWILVLMPLGGVMGLLGTLHMALGLGRIHGHFARNLLVSQQ